MSKELENLDEKKATGENSMSADATAAAGGAVKNRRADLKKKVPDGKIEKVKDESASKGTNDEGMKEEAENEVEFDLEEAFGGLFEGTDLSEEFKNKTIAIFESAVNQQVVAKMAELEEQFDADLAEQVEAAVDELVEKVDSYLDHVVETWMGENEIAIESNIKVEVAESLMDSLKGLVTEHNIDMDDESMDALAEVESRLEESNTKYNNVVDELIALKEEKQKLECDIAFAEVSEGLTETQIDKLGVLAEGLSFKTVEDYKTKVEAIKENYFTESTAPVQDETEFLEEEVDEGDKKPAVSPAVAGYVSALDKAFAR
jgi:hypothetical protein